MTYRIAYVRFTKTGAVYPVNCERSDLKPGDLVVVKTEIFDKPLKIAVFERLEFLNWNCKNTIICKRAEINKDGKGGYLIQRNSSPLYLETTANLEKELLKLAWERVQYSRHAYKWVFRKSFENSGSAIGLNNKGIAFQIYTKGWNGDPSGGPQRFPEGTYQLVRHYFYDSGIDLLEFTREFALNAYRPIAELAHYLEPIGKRHRPKPSSQGDPMADIREALGGAMTDTERGAFG